MRLDKYLKVSRLIKRRTVANEACDLGRITVNDRVARASSTSASAPSRSRSSPWRTTSARRTPPHSTASCRTIDAKQA